MSCVCCFFDPDYQMKLKKKNFNEERFENRLDYYKKLYLEEIESLSTVELCNCDYSQKYKKYSLFRNTTNDLLNSIKNNKANVEAFFDFFINIYIDYVTNGAFHAITNFSTFLSNEQLIRGSQNPVGYNQLLFRARMHEKMHETFNELELFHVPFSSRCKLTSQRFSVSGQPLLYLTKSIFSAEKEIEQKINKLQFAAYLPNYSYCFYNKKIFDLSFYIFDSIIKTLPGICEAGCKELGNCRAPNIYDVKRDILTNILLFPLKKDKNSFVEEYVIPQMFTSIIQTNDYDGIEYPSAKQYFEINGVHLFSDYNKNLAFFVKYQRTEDFDRSLKNSFLIFQQNKVKNQKIKLNDVKNYLESIKAPDNNNNYTDWLIPIANAKLHLEYLEHAKINKKPYFSTKEGKLELFFIMELAHEMEKQIKIQQERM